MSTQKPRKTLQPPQLPPNLSLTNWPAGKIEDYGEYVNLQVTGETLANQSAVQITVKNVWFKQAALGQMRLLAPQMSALRFENCDLAYTLWENASVRRIKMIGCRITGFKAVEAHLQDVLFQECIGTLAQFRYAKCKAVRFEKCNLVNADFQGADLSGVKFVHCDLSHAEMSHSTLVGTDFRSSKIEGLKVGARELPGVIVDHFQAAYLAS